MTKEQTEDEGHHENCGLAQALAAYRAKAGEG